MTLGKVITHPGVPNSTPVEWYLKIRKLGAEYPIEAVDILTGDGGHVRTKLKEKAPFGAVPLLELSDGTTIDQSNAIIAYLEAAHPEGTLDGGDAKTVALNRSWLDRVEKTITENGADAFRTGPGKAIFTNRYPCYPEAHETFVKRVDHFLGVFEGVVPETGVLGGDKLITADLRLVAGLEFLTAAAFGNVAGGLLEKYPKVTALFKRQQELLAPFK